MGQVGAKPSGLYSLVLGPNSVGDSFLQDLESGADNDPLRFNSRIYLNTTGSVIGFQSRPDSRGGTTGDVIGCEISPRTNDAGSGAIIAIKADPVVKDATAARTVSALRGIEVNIDLPNAGSAYTFTNDVAAFRIFPDFGSGHTFSGVRSVFEFAGPNTVDWQFLMEIEAACNGWVVRTAGTYSTADGYLVIRDSGNTYRIPFFTGVD